MKSVNQVRTRFAPSPTGALHAGTVRTALFAWLVAKQAGGEFILRIEDTDQAREVSGAVQNVIDSLHYVGLEWEEGPDKAGAYGPYVQSQRLQIYKEWAERLIAAGRAYVDPFSQDELKQLRDQAKAEKRPFLFREHRPTEFKTWDGKQPLRFKSEPQAYKWHDEVMGDLSTSPEVVDDFILIKSDGFPTYNFAHIVDDHLMNVSHVIRSQEFISSMPKFLNLYDALGIERPIFATVPMVLSEGGKKKLSKREGAKEILEYQRMGIPGEAMMNFLATLGWNDGTEQEIFNRDELMAKFKLSQVQRSGASFDEDRLTWMSGVHIRHMSPADLLARVKGYWPPEAADYDDAYRQQVLALVQERLKYFAELPDLTRFFFVDLPVNPKLISEHKPLGRMDPSEIKNLLEQARAALKASDFTVDDLSKRLNELLEKTGQKPGLLFSLIRIATTQAPASPALTDTLAVLGKEKSLHRIDFQLAAL